MAAVMPDTTVPARYVAVPGTLTALKQWVLWRYITKPGDTKPTKVPYQPSGHAASTDKWTTWCTFFEACAAEERFDGIGFVFAPNGNIYGFDADQMYDPATGTTNEDAVFWLTGLHTYTELSPSGAGLHGIGFGTLPGPGRNPKNLPFELYDHGRFFTITGRRVEVYPAELTEAPTAVLHSLYALLSRHETAAAPLLTGQGTSYLSDAEVLERAAKASNGAAFTALWGGDTSPYGGNDSSADLALCDRLAWWCNKDAAQVDRLFRQSGLMRPKWDSRRGGGTYGSMTIAEAIRITKDGYDPKAAHERLTSTPRPMNLDTGEILLPYEHTDLGNADRFADAYRDEVVYARYGATTGDWRAWNGTRWALEPIDALFARGGRIARAMHARATDSLTTDAGKALAKHALRTQANGRLAAMIDLAKNALGTWAADYDTDPWLLNCPNGTLELRTGRLRRHDPGDHITKLAGAPYLPAARCPRFLEFLEKFQPHADMRDFLQRAIGYTLTGVTYEQCLFFAYGMGGNGKSTLLNVVTALLGEYGRSAGAETFMIKKSDGGINNDVADLAGARGVISGELEDGKRFAESLIKVMTGSDQIKARFLHKEFFSFAPTFKLWMQGNHKPVIRGTDEGIWRRVRLIPFDVRIDDAQRVKGFSDALIASELPGILAWAVDGCRLWQESELAVPDAVKAATKT